MNKNFTTLAFSESVKVQQEKYGTRKSYSRMEKSGDKYILGQNEIDFIQDRDSFYMATINEDGWPYVQHRGGSKGFVHAINNTTLAYADFRGNGQYISTGNIFSSNKTSLILMDYPRRQRLKIWAESRIIDVGKDKKLDKITKAQDAPAKAERIVILDIQAFDWNCPQHITPRYTEEDLLQLQQEMN